MQVMSGLVPPDVFLPTGQQRSMFNFGKMEATAVFWNQAQEYLGLTRFRLWIVLGGEPMHSDRVGRRRMLSQLRAIRLGWLIQLKAMFSINTSALYAIDWQTGEMFFREGQPLTLVLPQPIEEEALVPA